MIVGFSGKSLVGKDASADYLLSNYGWDIKTGFAYNLKKSCSEMLNLDRDLFFTQEGKKSTLSVPISVDREFIGKVIKWMNRTHDVSIDLLDYRYMLGTTLHTPREVLQFVGTDIMREYSIDYHTDIVVNSLQRGKKVVVSDVRFSNEVTSILKSGGYVVRIDRPTNLRGVCDSKGIVEHSSETSLDCWDGWSYVLQNNGISLNTLYKKIDIMMNTLGI